MTEYIYKLKIEANNQAEANKIATFLNSIYSNCTNSELIEAAKQVEDDAKIIRKLIKVASNSFVRNTVSKFL